MFQADDSDDDEGEEISEVDLLQVSRYVTFFCRLIEQYLHFEMKIVRNCMFTLYICNIKKIFDAFHHFYLR